MEWHKVEDYPVGGVRYNAIHGRQEPHIETNFGGVEQCAILEERAVSASRLQRC